VHHFYRGSNWKTNTHKGILTILRDHSTSREDFIFFVDRLSTFLMEKSMIFLPYHRQTVVTPIGVTASGQKLSADVRDTYRANLPLRAEGVADNLWRINSSLVCL
jgi:uracil phosphoribosyltransferase